MSTTATKTESKRQPLTSYRVLQGTHIQTDPDGEERTYRAGVNDTFETHANMLAMNGGGGMQPKFQLLGAGSSVQANPGVTWNPAEESIEQFAARMKKDATPTGFTGDGKTDGHTPVDPKRGPTTIIPNNLLDPKK